MPRRNTGSELPLQLPLGDSCESAEEENALRKKDKSKGKLRKGNGKQAKSSRSTLPTPKAKPPWRLGRGGPTQSVTIAWR